MYCLEAVIVRQKVKISYQIKNINWRFRYKKGLCTIQMVFVALKALKLALKGQELASDTLEILNANAYHWNPCWKVDEQCHIFGCFSILLAKIQISDFRHYFFWLRVVILFTCLFTLRAAILASGCWCNHHKFQILHQKWTIDVLKLLKKLNQYVLTQKIIQMLINLGKTDDFRFNM